LSNIPFKDIEKGLTPKMHLEILKQVQNDKYQGYIHRNVMLNLFQHLRRLQGFIRLTAFFGLMKATNEKQKGEGS
jgi:hypothetical protein